MRQWDQCLNALSITKRHFGDRKECVGACSLLAKTTSFQLPTRWMTASLMEQNPPLSGKCLSTQRNDIKLKLSLDRFIVADKARKISALTKEQRLKIICESYAKAFDCEEAKKPVHYEEHNWSGEQYSGMQSNIAIVLI